MPFVGRYYSNTWVRKNILKQADEEMEDMDKEILAEQAIPQYAPPPEEVQPSAPKGQS